MNAAYRDHEPNGLTARWTAGAANVQVFDSRDNMGRAAAEAAAQRIRQAAKDKGSVRVVFAAAPSQSDFLEALQEIPDIPWRQVTAFHMDEYVGLPAEAPQRFANWLDSHLFSNVPLGTVHRINGSGNATEICHGYGEQINESPIDIVCLGIGVNGHIAFNDPPVADFKDIHTVKVVELDEICRQQQVDDGCFSTIHEVPTHAITLTVPALMSADTLFCVVPGKQKRNAVNVALNGPVSTDCPASILRTHMDCTVFLDTESSPND